MDTLIAEAIDYKITHYNEISQQYKHYEHLLKEALQLLNPNYDLTLHVFWEYNEAIHCISTEAGTFYPHLEKIEQFRNNFKADLHIYLEKKLNKLNETEKYILHTTTLNDNPSVKLLWIVSLKNIGQDGLHVLEHKKEYSFIRYLFTELFAKSHEETQHYLLKDKIMILSKEFINKHVKKLCKGQQHFTNFYETLTQFSISTYEGASICAKLLVTETLNIKQTIDYIVKFKKPIAYNQQREIRKILEMSGEDMYIIGDNQFIYGVGMLKQQPKSSSALIEFNLKSKFMFDMYLKVHRSKWDTYPLLNIQFNTPKFIESESVANKLTGTLNAQFATYFKQLGYTEVEIDRKVSTIEQLVISATKQSHGTMVVITTPEIAEQETTKLKTQSFPLDDTTQSFDFSEAIIKRLTNIDGALYMDIEGKIHSLGCILDGEALDACDNARGARYNSAIRYFNKSASISKNCVIVIISEDGMINILPDFASFEKQLYEKAYDNFNELKKESLFSIVDNKKKAAVHEFIGVKLLNEHLYDESLFNEAISLNPEATSHYLYRAKLFYEIQNYDKAVCDLTSLLERTPNDLYALNLLGLCYFEKYKSSSEQADFDASLHYLNESLNRLNHSLPYTLIGNLHRLNGDYATALTYFTNAEQAEEDFEDVIAETTTNHMGEETYYYEDEKEFNEGEYKYDIDEEEEDFDVYSEEDIPYFINRYYKGLLYFDKKDFYAAETELIQVFKYFKPVENMDALKNNILKLIECCQLHIGLEFLPIVTSDCFTVTTHPTEIPVFNMGGHAIPLTAEMIAYATHLKNHYSYNIYAILDLGNQYHYLFTRENFKDFFESSPYTVAEINRLVTWAHVVTVFEKRDYKVNYRFESNTIIAAEHPFY